MNKTLSIEEGNKLIAEFMGWKVEYVVRPNSVYPSRNVYEFNTINPNGETVRSSKAHDNIKIEDGIAEEWRELVNGRAGKYHSSWDWLMPVCQKINSNESVVKVEMNGVKDSIMPYINAISPMKRGVISLDINLTWQGVVYFIQWYNSQSK